jgi:hypothetical protein
MHEGSINIGFRQAEVVEKITATHKKGFHFLSQPSHRKIILVAGGPIPHRIGPNEKETTSQGRCHRIEWNLQAHS